MKSFAEFVSDQQPRQNLHLTHIDEALFEGGTRSAEATLDVLHSLIENDNRYQLTVKWDGAPAVFVGTDPADGRFFVGTKSVFNKNPKLYKTNEDIDADNMPEGKAIKLKESLRLLPKLGIPAHTVLQGDLLWTSGDHVYETYENKRYVTVHPNTLVYGWLAESEEGQRVRNADLGIVFHTTYRGRNNLSDYSATFGVNTDHLNVIPEVWFDNAYFKDKYSVMGLENRYRIQESIKSAQNSMNDFDRVVSVMNTIPSSGVGANIKTFYNSHIREGLYPQASKAFEQYIDYVKSYWDKTFISKLKTEEGVSRRKAQVAQLVQDINIDRKVFESSFKFVESVAEAKTSLINTLNESNTQKVFIKTDKGLQEASPEGYVAINKRTGEAYKLVDRTKFSYYNFSDTVKKGWEK